MDIRHRFFNRIKREKFDVAIDLSLSRQYCFILWLSGIKKRIGYNYKNRGKLLNCKVPLPNGYSDKPIPEYYLDLLRNFLGIQNGSFSLHMPLEEQDRLWADDFLRQHQVKPDDTVLGVIPGGGASWGKDFAHRHWAPEQYNKLCKMITEKLKLKVILLGSQQDLSICNQVKEGLEERMYVMSCGRTTIIRMWRQIGVLPRPPIKRRG